MRQYKAGQRVVNVDRDHWYFDGDDKDVARIIQTRGYRNQGEVTKLLRNRGIDVNPDTISRYTRYLKAMPTQSPAIAGVPTTAKEQRARAYTEGTLAGETPDVATKNIEQRKSAYPVVPKPTPKLKQAGQAIKSVLLSSGEDIQRALTELAVSEPQSPTAQANMQVLSELPERKKLEDVKGVVSGAVTQFASVMAEPVRSAIEYVAPKAKLGKPLQPQGSEAGKMLGTFIGDIAALPVDLVDYSLKGLAEDFHNMVEGRKYKAEALEPVKGLYNSANETLADLTTDFKKTIMEKPDEVAMLLLLATGASQGVKGAAKLGKDIAIANPMAKDFVEFYKQVPDDMKPVVTAQVIQEAKLLREMGMDVNPTVLKGVINARLQAGKIAEATKAGVEAGIESTKGKLFSNPIDPLFASAQAFIDAYRGKPSGAMKEVVHDINGVIDIKGAQRVAERYGFESYDDFVKTVGEIGGEAIQNAVSDRALDLATSIMEAKQQTEMPVDASIPPVEPPKPPIQENIGGASTPTAIPEGMTITDTQIYGNRPRVEIIKNLLEKEIEPVTQVEQVRQIADEMTVPELAEAINVLNAKGWDSIATESAILPAIRTAFNRKAVDIAKIDKEIAKVTADGGDVAALISQREIASKEFDAALTAFRSGASQAGTTLRMLQMATRPDMLFLKEGSASFHELLMDIAERTLPTEKVMELKVKEAIAKETPEYKEKLKAYEESVARADEAVKIVKDVDQNVADVQKAIDNVKAEISNVEKGQGLYKRKLDILSVNAEKLKQMLLKRPTPEQVTGAINAIENVKKDIADVNADIKTYQRLEVELPKAEAKLQAIIDKALEMGVDDGVINRMRDDLDAITDSIADVKEQIATSKALDESIKRAEQKLQQLQDTFGDTDLVAKKALLDSIRVDMRELGKMITQSDKLSKAIAKRQGAYDGVARQVNGVSEKAVKRYNELKIEQEPSPLDTKDVTDVMGTEKRFFDYVHEYLANNLLSGPRSIGANYFDNTLNVALHYTLIRPFANTMGRLKRATRGELSWKDFLAEQEWQKKTITDLVEGMRGSRQRFVDVMRTGLDNRMPAHEAGKIAGTGKLTPTNFFLRVQQASDAVFTPVIESIEMGLRQRETFNKAIADGSFAGTFDDWMYNVNQTIRNAQDPNVPLDLRGLERAGDTPEVIQANINSFKEKLIQNMELSNMTALQLLYQNQNWVSDGINKMIEGSAILTPLGDIKPIKWLQPFVKTPANIVMRMLEFGPWGIIRGTWGAVEKTKGFQEYLKSKGLSDTALLHRKEFQNAALARGIYGTLGGATLAIALEQLGYQVTGATPRAGTDERKEWDAKGYRPFSLVMPGKNGERGKAISFKAIPNLSAPLTMIAFANTMKATPTLKNFAMSALQMAGNAMSELPGLTGPQQLVETLTNQEEQGLTRLAATQGVQWLPYSSMARTANQMADPIMRDPETVWEYMMQSAAGFGAEYSKLPAKLDVMGRPIRGAYAGWQAGLPFSVSPLIYVPSKMPNRSDLNDAIKQTGLSFDALMTVDRFRVPEYQELLASYTMGIMDRLNEGVKDLEKPDVKSGKYPTVYPGKQRTVANVVKANDKFIQQNDAVVKMMNNKEIEELVAFVSPRLNEHMIKYALPSIDENGNIDYTMTRILSGNVSTFVDKHTSDGGIQERDALGMYKAFESERTVARNELMAYYIANVIKPRIIEERRKAGDSDAELTAAGLINNIEDIMHPLDVKAVKFRTNQTGVYPE